MPSSSTADPHLLAPPLAPPSPLSSAPCRIRGVRARASPAAAASLSAPLLLRRLSHRLRARQEETGSQPHRTTVGDGELHRTRWARASSSASARNRRPRRRGPRPRATGTHGWISSFSVHACATTTGSRTGPTSAAHVDGDKGAARLHAGSDGQPGAGHLSPYVETSPFLSAAQLRRGSGLEGDSGAARTRCKEALGGGPRLGWRLLKGHALLRPADRLSLRLIQVKELVLRHLLNLVKLGVLCMYLGAENVTLALELVAYTEEIQIHI
ncbi:hypothetical protein VPH35_006969 [Triticum aestivum]